MVNEGVPIPILLESTQRKDSTIVWIAGQENSNYQLTVPFKDTLLSAKISTRKLQDFKINPTNNLTSNELEIFDTLFLEFDLPITKIDTQKIMVFKNDSTPIPFRIQIKNLRKLQLIPQEGQNRIFLLPGALSFLNDRTFQDSINLTFIRKTANKYANLELNLENKPSEFLILKLFKGDKLSAESLVSVTDSVVYFANMNPGEYKLQVIIDTNKNGAFDTGDYPQRRQPEQIIWFHQPITLRANWDTTQPVSFQKSGK
jgi:hypothetical protein